MNRDHSQDSASSWSPPALDTDAALEFLYRNANPIESTRLAHWRGDVDDDAFWQALSPYQNPDGGWANGIDPDYTGTISSVQSTIEALRILLAHQQADHTNTARTIQFLKQNVLPDGTWQEAPEVMSQNCPPWYAPARYRIWETACVAGYALTMGYTELWSPATRYVRNVWPQLPPADQPHIYWAVLLLIGRSKNDQDVAISERSLDELSRFVSRERIDAFDCSWVVEILATLELHGSDGLLQQLADCLAARQGSDGGIMTDYGEHMRGRATFNALMAFALLNQRYGHLG